jgi:hypothetical protein
LPRRCARSHRKLAKARTITHGAAHRKDGDGEGDEGEREREGKSLLVLMGAFLFFFFLRAYFFQGKYVQEINGKLIHGTFKYAFVSAF